MAAMAFACDTALHFFSLLVLSLACPQFPPLMSSDIMANMMLQNGLQHFNIVIKFLLNKKVSPYNYVVNQ